jgi:hypothetical protein
MRKRQILQQMMMSLQQRASRNRAWHMIELQKQEEYLPDDAPLISEQIEQIKQSVRTKYA